MTQLTIMAIVLLAGGLWLIVQALRRLRQGRPLAVAGRLLSALVLGLAGSTLILLGTAIQGYRALTREETIALVEIEPRGPQYYLARLRFPDGREQRFELQGDEIQLDAHILKWRPLAAWFGLHTLYQLDRLGGRYRDIDDARRRPRTLYPLHDTTGHWNLFDLRRRHPWLAPLVDAEYGSATFVAADRPQRWQLRVSTSGLLLRPATRPAP